MQRIISTILSLLLLLWSLGATADINCNCHIVETMDQEVSSTGISGHDCCSEVPAEPQPDREADTCHSETTGPDARSDVPAVSTELCQMMCTLAAVSPEMLPVVKENKVSPLAIAGVNPASTIISVCLLTETPSYETTIPLSPARFLLHQSFLI